MWAAKLAEIAAANAAAEQQERGGPGTAGQPRTTKKATDATKDPLADPAAAAADSEAAQVDIDAVRSKFRAIVMRAAQNVPEERVKRKFGACSLSSEKCWVRVPNLLSSTADTFWRAQVSPSITEVY